MTDLGNDVKIKFDEHVKIDGFVKRFAGKARKS